MENQTQRKIFCAAPRSDKSSFYIGYIQSYDNIHVVVTDVENSTNQTFLWTELLSISTDLSYKNFNINDALALYRNSANDYTSIYYPADIIKTTQKRIYLKWNTKACVYPLTHKFNQYAHIFPVAMNKHYFKNSDSYKTLMESQQQNNEINLSNEYGMDHCAELLLEETTQSNVNDENKLNVSMSDLSINIDQKIYNKYKQGLINMNDEQIAASYHTQMDARTLYDALEDNPFKTGREPVIERASKYNNFNDMWRFEGNQWNYNPFTIRDKAGELFHIGFVYDYNNIGQIVKFSMPTNKKIYDETNSSFLDFIFGSKVSKAKHPQIPLVMCKAPRYGVRQIKMVYEIRCNFFSTEAECPTVLKITYFPKRQLVLIEFIKYPCRHIAHDIAGIVRQTNRSKFGKQIASVEMENIIENIDENDERYIFGNRMREPSTIAQLRNIRYYNNATIKQPWKLPKGKGNETLRLYGKVQHIIMEWKAEDQQNLDCRGLRFHELGWGHSFDSVNLSISIYHQSHHRVFQRMSKKGVAFYGHLDGTSNCIEKSGKMEWMLNILHLESPVQRRPINAGVIKFIFQPGEECGGG
eukprot:38658_1